MTLLLVLGVDLGEVVEVLKATEVGTRGHRVAQVALRRLLLELYVWQVLQVAVELGELVELGDAQGLGS